QSVPFLSISFVNGNGATSKSQINAVSVVITGLNFTWDSNIGLSPLLTISAALRLNGFQVLSTIFKITLAPSFETFLLVTLGAVMVVKTSDALEPVAA